MDLVVFLLISMIKGIFRISVGHLLGIRWISVRYLLDIQRISTKYPLLPENTQLVSGIIIIQHIIVVSMAPFACIPDISALMFVSLSL
jgi:hypothetical protein